jgi:hypothetical protein
MDGEEMALSRKIRNEKFVNLRISRKEFLHLGNHLFEQITMYNSEDDDGKEAYDKKQIEALDAIFKRMKQVSGL